jgi:fructose-1,6-bisphosphatase/inositol monophosphatase family enzyme
MPLFGTLVGLRDELENRIVFGMIDVPALKERWAGEGLACSFNGRPAHVSKCRSLEASQLYTSSPDIFSPDDWAAFEAVSSGVLYRRFGGDCYLYGLLASGHCDLVIETSLKVFDFMALVPVVEGAGGIMRDWSGKPLTPHSDGRVVAAATEDLLVQALEILQHRKADAAQ